MPFVKSSMTDTEDTCLGCARRDGLLLLVQLASAAFSLTKYLEI